MLDNTPQANYNREKYNLNQIESQKPELVDYSLSTVIVDGCPITGPEKYDQLLNLLLKNFGQFGKINGHYFPVDDSKKTIGYIYLTYDLVKSAKKAASSMNGVNLDKNHTFKCCLLSDFDGIVNVKEEWSEPKLDNFRYQSTMKDWLQNELARDQFFTLQDGSLTGTIYWFNTSEPVVVKNKEKWTNNVLVWSPQGVYLASMQDKKVTLSGGDDFEVLARFVHPGVNMLDFSPKENFLITASLSQAYDPSQKIPLYDFSIWEIRKMVERRSFTLPSLRWPAFKWSHDDKYVGCVREGGIYIYETKTFKLLNKNAIKVSTNNISDFAWSPTDNVLSYWVPEGENIPARVVLIEIPSCKELCSKNLFNVNEITLIWQQSGDYLAIQGHRYTKKKLDADKQYKYYGTYLNFDVVRMREKEYPVDSITIKNSTISCFQWEPIGNKFAYFSTHSTTNVLAVHISQVSKNDKIKEIGTIEKPNGRFNELKWSPKGNILVIAQTKTVDGKIEFIDANECEVIKECNHPMVNELVWDPTGRYLASAVLFGSQKTDNAIIFWTNYGKQLHKLPMNQLKFFRWRPRPQTCLTQEQINNTKKNLGKYISKFENEDKMLASSTTRKILEKRKNLSERYDKWRMELLQKLKERILEKGVKEEIENDEDMFETIVPILVEKRKEAYKEGRE